MKGLKTDFDAFWKREIEVFLPIFKGRRVCRYRAKESS